MMQQVVAAEEGQKAGWCHSLLHTDTVGVVEILEVMKMHLPVQVEKSGNLPRSKWTERLSKWKREFQMYALCWDPNIPNA